MRFEMLKETKHPKKNLFLQYGNWHWDDSEPSQGYRFIWKSPEGKLLPQRGQAYIESLDEAMELMAQAMKEGWASPKTWTE
ncbi:MULTISPECIES: hypothetical protein [Psychrilyobacter]|uniref:Uncharacterized protein n=1 Tax=Psychrilyobacter piezotolerans TaxID=2293438 RepID=A0ABX9KDX5_9FUSO|nr:MULTISPECIES: hypothetical protein [Psychrilyobacter]MCS5421924.1 hypothetical protein [Psychrilyobacter sp. S5]NDI78942.1 hypothetical protein [Psychrilyobacter piezotolerans]RDE59235.1 hypothetical protein DV867_13280 [Psychrilyobacter sp. S5]REI39795.1 hypothetical protein DYH56_13280 [Psychrilyobacter piezotolerans]